MIKFFQTREEAIQYALKLSRDREREKDREYLLISIEYAIASGMIGFN